MIAFDGLTVSYGDTVALHAISGVVADGEWLGIIGPNGSGKTSLLNAIARLLPSGGTVTVCGLPGRPEPARASPADRLRAAAAGTAAGHDGR